MRKAVASSQLGRRKSSVEPSREAVFVRGPRMPSSARDKTLRPSTANSFTRSSAGGTSIARDESNVDEPEELRKGLGIKFSKENVFQRGRQRFQVSKSVILQSTQDPPSH